MYNGVKLQVNDTSESLERDATIQLVCDEGYSIKYGVSNSFYCNDYADYLCKPNCVISHMDSTTNLTIQAGSTRALGNATELKQGESMLVECTAEGSSFVNSSSYSTSQTITCGDSSTLTVPTCRPACDVPELQSSITSTWKMYALLSDTPIHSYTESQSEPVKYVSVEQSATVDRCEAYYGFIVNETDSPMAEFRCGYNTNNDTSTFTSNSTSIDYQCFALPNITVTTLGEGRVKITATVDAENTARGLRMESVTVTRSRPSPALTILTLNSTDAASGLQNLSSGLEYDNADMMFGTTNDFRISINYAGYSSSLSTSDQILMPPQAVQADITIVDFDGTTGLKVSLSEYLESASYKDEIPLSNFMDLDYYGETVMFTFELIVRRETVRVVKNIDIRVANEENFGTAVQDNEHMFRMYTISVPKGTLTKGDNCSVKITSVSVGGAIGGSLSIPAVVGETTRAGAGANIASLTLVVACMLMMLVVDRHE